MLRSKKGKVYALIAAICYSILVAYSSISVGRMLIYDFFLISYSYRSMINIIVLLGFAVTLFTKSVKAFTFAAGADVLRCIFSLIDNLFIETWGILFLISAGALFAVVLLALKRSADVKKLWFVPFAALALSCLVFWTQFFIDDLNVRFYMSTPVAVLMDAVKIVALVFVGLWLKESAFPSTVDAIYEYTPYDHAAFAAASDSEVSGADSLRMLKELLDRGIITKEEYEAKKKQILAP